VRILLRVFVLAGGALAMVRGAQTLNGWLVTVGLVLCIIVALAAIASCDVDELMPASRQICNRCLAVPCSCEVAV
jgi:hypothetical protein